VAAEVPSIAWGAESECCIAQIYEIRHDKGECYAVKKDELINHSADKNTGRTLQLQLAAKINLSKQHHCCKKHKPRPPDTSLKPQKHKPRPPDTSLRRQVGCTANAATVH